MTTEKELQSQVHFQEGCRVYQSGLNAVKQGKWPEVRENASFEDVLKETQKVPVPQKGMDR